MPMLPFLHLVPREVRASFHIGEGGAGVEEGVMMFGEEGVKEGKKEGEG